MENIYTQHTPHIISTLESLIKGRLKDTLFPFVEGSSRDRPQDIIAFMVGGTTYAESRAVSQFVAANAGQGPGSGMRIVLGGTCVHNTKTCVG